MGDSVLKLDFNFSVLNLNYKNLDGMFVMATCLGFSK